MIAHAARDCCFVVDKKEQRKATMEPFVARVFDIARPFKSFLGSVRSRRSLGGALASISARSDLGYISAQGFAVENRPADPQTAERMGQYLRAARSRNEPFVTSVSDMHFLLFLCNILDLNVDLPVVAAVRPPLCARRRRLAAVVVLRVVVLVDHVPYLAGALRAHRRRRRRRGGSRRLPDDDQLLRRPRVISADPRRDLGRSRATTRYRELEMVADGLRRPTTLSAAAHRTAAPGGSWQHKWLAATLYSDAHESRARGRGGAGANNPTAYAV